MKKILIPGLILAAYMGLLVTIQMMQLLPQNGSAPLIMTLIILLVDFFVLFSLLKWVKRKYYSDNITFKEVFSNGVFIGVFATVLVSVCVFVFLSYIDPSAMEIIKKITEEQKQKAIERVGSLPPSQEKLMNATQTPIAQALGVLSLIILWVLFSLISAAMLKTKNPIKSP
ncbi:MAG TPA: DUF4199 domain-containing protein [Bacteroidia bacterium]|nr:DUF4199 domain-containing protein [Bacteroidia bacterium]